MRDYLKHDILLQEIGKMFYLAVYSFRKTADLHVSPAYQTFTWSGFETHVQVYFSEVSSCNDRIHDN